MSRLLLALVGEYPWINILVFSLKVHILLKNVKNVKKKVPQLTAKMSRLLLALVGEYPRINILVFSLKVHILLKNVKNVKKNVP